jgi:hypothetical protein
MNGDISFSKFLLTITIPAYCTFVKTSKKPSSMKRIILLLTLLALAPATYSQIETPAPSPLQKIEQKVGLTEFTLTYSRPSMKGRKIFGGLVPFGGAVWRTGANANTTISFSDKVWVGDTELPAGTYAIYSKPEATYWDVMFYTDSNNWGAPAEWDESKVAAPLG